MRPSISIDGFDELQDILKNVAPREARNLLRNATQATAGKVRDEMRKRVRTQSYDEGTLRKAIVSRRERVQGDEVASTVRITHGKGAMNDAWYWHFVNSGTVNMVARPFIEPSVESIRPQLPAIFREEFGKKYEALLRRKAKRAGK